MVRAIANVQLEVTEATPRRAARLFVETHGRCPDLIEDRTGYVDVVGQCLECHGVILDGDDYATVVSLSPETGQTTDGLLCVDCKSDVELCRADEALAFVGSGI